MKYQVESHSSKGPYRDNNEDAIDFGFDESADFFWMIVADGMGGHKAGEVASDMLAQLVKREIKELNQNYAQNWEQWIQTVIEQANGAIYQAAKKSKKLSGMGTTGVLLILYQKQCFIGWVGDSRAYLLRTRELSQLTRDHSAIQYLLDKGSITAEEAEQSDNKHLLSRAIGVGKTIEVDVISNNLSLGDTLFLSTDGIHDYLSNMVLSGYLADFSAGRKVAAKMINQAMAQGSRDNLTLGIVSLR